MNRELLAFKLKDYARKKIADNMLWEFTDQYERWKIYIGKLALAHEAALNEHTALLKSAADERQRSFELSMMALNLVFSPVISWIGSAIQYRVMPKFTTVWRREAFAGEMFGRLVPTEAAAANQVMGNFASELASLGLRHVKPLLIADRRQPVSGDFAKTVQSWAAFKQGLEKTIYDKQVEAAADVRALVNKIDLSVNFGKELCDDLFEAHPSLRSASDSVAERGGYACINLVLNEMRKSWASHWFYFGNNPPSSVTFLTERMIQKQLWRLWMLEEELAVEPRQSYGKDVDPTVQYSSRSGLFFDDPILDKLSDLNFPVNSFMRSLPSAIVDDPREGSNYKNLEPMKKAIQSLVDWGTTTGRPHQGLLDRGTVRPLVSIERYTSPIVTSLFRAN